MKNKANTHGKTRIALASILLATLLAGCGGVSDKDLKAAENIISGRIDRRVDQVYPGYSDWVTGGIGSSSSGGLYQTDYNLEYSNMEVVDKDGQGRYLITGDVTVTSGSQEGKGARVAAVLQDYNGRADFCQAEVIADMNDGGEHEGKVLEKMKEMNAWGSEVSNPPGTDYLNYLDAKGLRGIEGSLQVANYILNLEEHEAKLAGVTEEDIDKAADAVAEKSASMTTEDGGIFTLDGEPDSDGHGRYLITTKVVLVGSGYNCKAVRMVAPDVDKEFALAFREGSIDTSDLVDKANESNEIWTVYCQQGEEQELADAMKGSSNWGLEGEGLGAPTSDKDKNEKNLAEKVASFLVGWYDYEDLKSKGDGQGRYLITGCSTTVGDMMRETDYFWAAVVSFKEGFLTDEHIKEWKDTNGSQEERFELLSQWAAEGNVLVIGPNPVREEVYYDGEENAGIDDMKTKARWGWPSASGFSEDSQAEFLSLLHSTEGVTVSDAGSTEGSEPTRDAETVEAESKIAALAVSQMAEWLGWGKYVVGEVEGDGYGRYYVTGQVWSADGMDDSLVGTLVLVKDGFVPKGASEEDIANLAGDMNLVSGDDVYIWDSYVGELYDELWSQVVYPSNYGKGPFTEEEIEALGG